MSAKRTEMEGMLVGLMPHSEEQIIAVYHRRERLRAVFLHFFPGQGNETFALHSVIAIPVPRDPDIPF